MKSINWSCIRAKLLSSPFSVVLVRPVFTENVDLLSILIEIGHEAELSNCGSLSVKRMKWHGVALDARRGLHASKSHLTFTVRP